MYSFEIELGETIVLDSDDVTSVGCIEIAWAQ
jgi:hypothetical protein